MDLEQTFRNEFLSENCSDVLRELALDRRCTDARIHCRDGKKVPVSRLLLALASEYLREALETVGEASSTPISVYIKDFDSTVVVKLVKFLSTGQAKCDIETFRELGDLIKVLRIDSSSSFVKAEVEENEDERTREGQESDENRSKINGGTVEVAVKVEDQLEEGEEDEEDDNGDEYLLYRHFLDEEEPKRRRKKKRRRSSANDLDDFVVYESESDISYSFSESDQSDQEPRLSSSSNRRQGSYKCAKCHVTFSSYDAITEHRNREYKSEPWTCEVCGEKFDKDIQYRSHMNKHKRQNDIPVSCHICGKRYKGNTPGYKRHLRSHQDGGGDSVSCEFCGKLFKSKSSLKLHIKNMHETTEKKFECEYCHKKFRTKGSLTVHLLCHTGKRNYVCETCGYAGVSISRLKAHLMTHVVDKPFQCQICKKGFDKKHMLKDHETVVHQNERRFRCEKCGKCFNLERHLNNHNFSVHADLSYKCKICEKPYKTIIGVKYHLIMHSDTYPFKCNACGETFKHNEVGRRHVRAHHPEVKGLGVQFIHNQRLKELEETCIIDITKENNQQQQQLQMQQPQQQEQFANYTNSQQLQN